MTFNSSSTRHPDISVEDDDDDDSGSEFDDVYRTAEIAIPFALAVVVIVVLCVTIAFSKMRKRRARRQNNGQGHFPAISGGVPMNAAAYMNHEFQSGSSQITPCPHLSPPPPLYTTPGTAIEQPPTHYNPIPYSPAILPPKYEDIFKENAPTQEVNREQTISGENQVSSSVTDNVPAHRDQNLSSTDKLQGVNTSPDIPLQSQVIPATSDSPSTTQQSSQPPDVPSNNHSGRGEGQAGHINTSFISSDETDCN